VATDALQHIEFNTLALNATQEQRTARLREIDLERKHIMLAFKADEARQANLRPEHLRLVKAKEHVEKLKDVRHQVIKDLYQEISDLERVYQTIADRLAPEPEPEPPAINWQEGTLQECRKALAQRLKIPTLDYDSILYTSTEDKLRVYKEMDTGGYAVNRNCPEISKRPDKVQLRGVTDFRRNFGLFSIELLCLVRLDQDGNCTAEE
jgi:hypothetical protein